VTHEDLVAAGFDLTGASASQLGLFTRDVPVPIFVGGETRFGPGSYIEFWGEALDTLYTKTNVYRLLTGQKKPARASVSTATASGAAAVAYPETKRFERNRTYSYSSPLADPFYDTRLLAFTTPVQATFQFSIEDYLSGEGPSHLDVDVYGGSIFPNFSPNHHVEFFVNGTRIGESFFDGTAGVRFQGEIPEGVLAEGSNTLALRLPADTGARFDVVFLDGYSVTYPRAFQSLEGKLSFFGANGRFEIAGLSPGSAVAYRQDGADLVKLTGLETIQDDTGFIAVVPGSGTPARYSIASDTDLLSPTSIQPSRPQIDIRSGSATYLIVTHDAFLSGLGPLVAARTAQGYSVKVVDVEDVYSQFSGGIFDANAIHEYIRHAHKSMGTRYVLLVGGDSYDYHDYLGLAPVSFIPSLYRATSEAVRFAPSDTAYADVDGDGIPDLAIGRFPVRSLQELANVVAKTLEYEAMDYSLRAIFAADYADDGANQSFRNASQALVDKLPSDWQALRVYLDDIPLSEARSNLFSGIANGTALTYYLGHSGLSSWGSPARPVSQHLFTTGDVASLANEGRPTAIAQFGCWNTYFSSPRTESMGSRLILADDRGAAAIMGAATLTLDANGNRYGSLLAPILTEAGRSVGDAVLLAKRKLIDSAPSGTDLRDIILGWTLLGDPALRVNP
jgi:hypothetical protein